MQLFDAIIARIARGAIIWRNYADNCTGRAERAMARRFQDPRKTPRPAARTADAAQRLDLGRGRFSDGADECAPTNAELSAVSGRARRRRRTPGAPSRNAPAAVL